VFHFILHSFIFQNVAVVFGGAIFSKLTGGLTNPGVQAPGPNGQTTFYPNPAAADMALASASARTAAPGGSSIDGSIGPDGTENETATNTPPPDNPQPKLVQPSWADAQASSPGAPLANKELTSKGKLLSLLIQTGIGAGEGYAAASQGSPRFGYPGAGVGFAAGARVPMQIAENANALREEQLKQNLTSAQISALPQQQHAELAKTQAETNWYNQRGEAVGLHSLKPGDILVNKDGETLGNGADVGATAQAKATGKAEGTAEAVTSMGGTPAQVLSALGVKTPTEKNTSTAQMYLDAANGDPGAAIKAMNNDRTQHSITLHSLIANLRPTASSDNAQLRSDPTYTGLLRQRDGLLQAANHELINGELDPNSATTVAKLQSQADGLTQQMNARRAAILKPSSSTASPTAGGGTVRMTGPKGTFDVPAAKVGVFQQNGYKQAGQ